MHLDDVLSEGWLSALLSTAALAVIVPGLKGNGQPRKRSEIIAERHARYEETNRAIDKLVAEAHARLTRQFAKTIGAIYVRFSTWMQDSAEDQVRSILEFAVANDIFVPRENVYFDLGVRGSKNKREGLDRLRDMLRGRKVKVLLLFATNRLFRKVYRTLEFVEEVVSEHAIRCVFVKSGVDSANKDQWQMLLHFRAIMDEFQVKVGAEHIRAALEGLFLEGYVYGTLTFGYAGEPVPGKFTNSKRPRCRIVIHPDEAKIVQLIFEWFVKGDSLNDIARKLNAFPGVPRPRKSNGIGWTHNAVRAVLLRTAYRGLWNFSVTEKTFLPTKDYARQIPREKPLRQADFENLRIIPDALWFAAQTRLAKNRRIRGRKTTREDADRSPRVLSGLLWCPEHDRPLRACSAFGKYLGCPSCAMLQPDQRPLFSKPLRKVVLQRLCDKLTELIRVDPHLVDKVISATQAEAVASQRPDNSEIERLEKTVAGLTRRITFNMNNPGETEEDEREITETLRALRRQRKEAQDQLDLFKAAASQPVCVPTGDEVKLLIERFSDSLQRAAAVQLGDGQDAARNILETLTGGRIEMYQQGERKEMKGWLQGRFTVKVVDFLVEKSIGRKPSQEGESIEVAIDFRRPRKTDSDADQAIAWWLDGDLNMEIADKLGSGQGYVSRLLRIGAERRGTTLEALREQRKTRPVDPNRAPRYQRIADEVKKLWWDELYPMAVTARRLDCSTTMVKAAVRFWFESRGLPVPTFKEWECQLENRVILLFDENQLEIQEIGDAVHLGRTKVMEIVRDAYRRLGKDVPDGRTRRSHLHGGQTSTRPSST